MPILIKMNENDISKIIENMDHSQLLGEGTFGKVYKEKNYVIKEINFIRDSNNENNIEYQSEIFEEEVKTWKELTNINKLKPFLPEFVGSENMGDKGYIIQKYEPVVDMFDYLERYKTQKLPYKDGSELFNKILEGFWLLQKHNFIHRDIKPGNILIRTGEHNKNIPIIIDFGLACKLPCNDTNSVGTPFYRPSNFINKTNRNRGYSIVRNFPVTKKAHQNGRIGWLGCLSCRRGTQAKRTVRIKERNKRLNSFYSGKTDDFAVGLVVEELFDIINWKDHDESKENAKDIITVLKHRIVPHLAASVGRNKQRNTVMKSLMNGTFRPEHI